MKKCLAKLREFVELSPDIIQFKIGDNFYEMERLKDGNWDLFVVFGKDLRLDIRKLKGLDRDQVEAVLKSRFKNLEIY